MRARYKELMERYGLVAVLVYLSTSLCVFLPTLVAIQFGVDVGEWVGSDAAGTGGAVFLSWLAVKATQIPRLFVTAAVTPIVGRYIKLPLPTFDDEPAAEGEADSPAAEPEPESA